MASITFTHVGYTTEIAPGETHYGHRNHAEGQKVWALSVDAELLPTATLLAGDTAIIETKVWYQQNYDGQNFEREVHWSIKNIGKKKAAYNIHRVMIGE
jgi:hypothetical protein